MADGTRFKLKEEKLGKMEWRFADLLEELGKNKVDLEKRRDEMWKRLERVEGGLDLLKGLQTQRVMVEDSMVPSSIESNFPVITDAIHSTITGTTNSQASIYLANSSLPTSNTSITHPSYHTTVNTNPTTSNYVINPPYYSHTVYNSCYSI